MFVFLSPITCHKNDRKLRAKLHVLNVNIYNIYYVQLYMVYIILGMHRSDTQDRYRLRSGNFLQIRYRSDETDPNPMLCIYYSVLLLRLTKATKHHKALSSFRALYLKCSEAVPLFNLRHRLIFWVVKFKFTNCSLRWGCLLSSIQHSNCTLRSVTTVKLFKSAQ